MKLSCLTTYLHYSRMYLTSWILQEPWLYAPCSDILRPEETGYKTCNSCPHHWLEQYPMTILNPITEERTDLYSRFRTITSVLGGSREDGDATCWSTVHEQSRVRRFLRPCEKTPRKQESCDLCPSITRFLHKLEWAFLPLPVCDNRSGFHFKLPITLPIAIQKNVIHKLSSCDLALVTI